MPTLVPLSLAEPELKAGDVTEVMLFPIGEWAVNSPTMMARYPKGLPLTQDTADQIIANFAGGVLGTEVQFTLSDGTHAGGGPAAFWVQRLYCAPYEWEGRSGDACWCSAKWTKPGAEAVNNAEFKYVSLEAGPLLTNDGAEVPWVLQGGVLTNHPLLKIMPSLEDAPSALAASEGERAAEFEVDLMALAERVTKSEGDAGDFPAAAYAYVPDPSAPSTWKLRLWATPEGGPDAGIVGAAIAALGKGFRGQKVEIPTADLPAVKAKVRAAWKKANPDKDTADLPEVIRAAEGEDPVAALLDDMDAIAEKVDAALKGRTGMPLFRTMLSQARARIAAHHRVEASEDGTTLGQPVEATDGTPALASPSRSQAVAAGKAGEGTGAATAEEPAAKRGAEHRMNSKALSILKLAEDATDDALSAAVLALAEERDNAVQALEERDKADRTREFEARLAEAMKPDEDSVVHILPGEKDAYLKLAELDHEAALVAIEARVKGPGLKLGAEGVGSEGDADDEKPADVELAERAKERAAKESITYAAAERLVLAEDPALAERYRDFRMNPGKEA